jgi:hypothetical protein
MTDYSDKRCLVIDSGLFPHIAQKLAESFGEVEYYCPWVMGGFPTEKKRMLGVGIPGVKRVYSWLKRIRAADIVVAPDVYTHDEVEHVRDLGIPCWGPGRAEALEIERWQTRDLMAEMKMPIVSAELITGITELRDYLADKEDVWIKRSITRGDGETFHHVNAVQTEEWLTDQETKLGPRKESFEFIVEANVPGIETGYDGCCVDGEYNPVGGYGYELKDQAYILKVSDFAAMPLAIRGVTQQFGEALGQLGCRGFYSNEIRVAEDGTPYLIDPTVRAGRPPSECYIEVFDNWAEVIYEGARGNTVVLNPVARYAAEIVLKSDWVREHYMTVQFPKDRLRWIKIGNSCVIDDVWRVIPQDDPEFGSAIGIGDTMEEAIDMAVENAKTVEANGVSYKDDVKDGLAAAVQKGRDAGIDF